MTRADYEIEPVDLKAMLGSPKEPVLLDVRRYDEVQICSIEGAVHIPIDELPERLEELAPDQETVVVCHHGVRSLSATVFLRSQGFRKVRSLAGGIDRWSVAIDSSVPRY